MFSYMTNKDFPFLDMRFTFMKINSFICVITIISRPEIRFTQLYVRFAAYFFRNIIFSIQWKIKGKVFFS